MGACEPCRQVVEEGLQRRLVAELRIGLGDPVEILRPALLGQRDAGAKPGAEPLHRRRHDIAQHAGALAAADHQEPQALAGGRQDIRAVAQRRDLGAHGVAGHQAARRGERLDAMRRGEGQRDQPRAARDQPVGAAQHRVLLVHQGRDLQGLRGEPGRHRCVAAERRERDRPVPAQQQEALAEAQRELGEAAQARGQRTRRARGADHVRAHALRQIAGATPVADEDRGLAAPLEFGGKGQGREHVPPGAAGGDHDRPVHA